MSRSGPHVPPMPLIPNVPYFCRCGKALGYPGICKPCADGMLAEEVKEAAWFKVRERIPACYRWARIEVPIRRNGHSISVRAQRDASEWCSDSGRYNKTLMLRGTDTHCFKSTLAAAIVRAELEYGLEAYFVPAPHLSPEAPEDDRARAIFAVRNMSALVVIDDLAAVLGGAPAGSGLAAQRKATLDYWIRQRWEKQATTVYTTALPDEGTGATAGIVETFGEDIFARLRNPSVCKTVEMARVK